MRHCPFDGVNAALYSCYLKNLSILSIEVKESLRSQISS